MSYVPNYESFLNSSNMSVEPVTISNNTIENYEDNAKAMGVDIVYDINGNKIGYEKNVSVTDFEDGEYVEKTVKIPLYASKNPNSTEDNLIIDYKPYPSYTATDTDKYEEGSVTFVMDKNEYFKEVMANSGYDVNLDEINTELLNSMWEHLNEDITHKNGIVNDPIARSIFGTAGIDPSMFNSDSMAYGRLKLDEFGLKYLHDEDGVASLLKAAAAVGMTTVSDVIEDDAETKDFFRWHVHDGDYVTLKSPNEHGDKFDENWFAAFIRPFLYFDLGYPNLVGYPDDESFETHYTIDNTIHPPGELIPTFFDDDVYNAVNKHVNIWFAEVMGPDDGFDKWIINTNFMGYYLDENINNAEVINNYPERGYAVLRCYGTYYIPNNNKNFRRSYWSTKGLKNVTWQGYGQGIDGGRNFILVYSYDDFTAYLSDLISGGQTASYNTLRQSWFVLAGCKRGSNIPGITKNANAITITANDTVADIKLKMQQDRPDWYDNSVTINEYNIYNDTTNPVTYLPIGGGDTPQTTPITRETVEKASVYNYNYTYNQVPTNPTPLPSSLNPAVGNLKSNKFWSVYRITNAQLDELGAQLWDQDIIDILKQAFVNPTDGIICLQQMYMVPPATKDVEVCLGTYNTHVHAMLVENFKLNLSCGIAKVPRYYNDPRDFTETTVNVFLPFIGFRELDARDVIGGAIELQYNIDVLTGTCVAFISPLKKEASQHETNLTTASYMFEGNCAVQLPITAADRSRMLSGILGGGAIGIKAGGKVGAFHGALAGGVLGATLGALQGLQKSVYRSGDISANAGALALTMIPYVLVDRQQPADAYVYPRFYGKPNNETIALELCSGFTRVKEVIFNTINASEYEKSEIDRLLKQGIII